MFAEISEKAPAPYFEFPCPIGYHTHMIDQKTVAHLAELSRMKIGADEIARLGKELGSILDYVGALEAVDTKGISKEGSVGLLRNVWREDVATSQGDREAILDEAPMREGDFVAVKKVIEYER